MIIIKIVCIGDVVLITVVCHVNLCFLFNLDSVCYSCETEDKRVLFAICIVGAMAGILTFVANATILIICCKKHAKMLLSKQY
jgi:hypothetical protein